MMFSFNTRLQALQNTLPVIANLQLRCVFKTWFSRCCREDWTNLSWSWIMQKLRLLIEELHAAGQSKCAARQMKPCRGHSQTPAMHASLHHPFHNYLLWTIARHLIAASSLTPMSQLWQKEFTQPAPPAPQRKISHPNKNKGHRSRDAAVCDHLVGLKLDSALNLSFLD